MHLNLNLDLVLEVRTLPLSKIMVTISINNREFTVSALNSVLQACESAGYIVPRFCYHEKLSVAGSCRMCLVEIQKSPKPVVSCAMPVSKGMVVFTNTPLVKKAREAILESLLVNHPLDCPICDQGGECDLQDETLVYGVDRGRYYEFKRGVEDKECGPIIKTIMTRCIHCTRCIRFSSEIAGLEGLGAFGRGKETEIGTYIQTFINTELSGNLVDLCPVGALTSKPYAYKARVWELQKCDSIDFFDSVCSDITVYTRKASQNTYKEELSNLIPEDSIVRILPKNDGLYEDNWISDRTRYAFDGLKKNSADTLMFDLEGFIIELGTRTATSTYVHEVLSWLESDPILGGNCPSVSQKIGAVMGSICNLQEVYFTSQFLKLCGSTDIQVGNIAPKTNYDLPFYYNFNRTIASLNNLNTLLIIGLNTRFETSVLNSTLRKHQLNRGLNFFTVGPYAPLKLRQKHIGNSLRTLISLSENKIKEVLSCYLELNTSIFYGFESLRNKHGFLLQNIVRFLGKKLCTRTLAGDRLGLVHANISTLNFANLGIFSGVRSSLFVDTLQDKEISTLFLIQSEQFKSDKWLSPSNYTHVVGVSTNSTTTIKYDSLIPITSLYEKDGFLFNIEGRLRKMNKVVAPKTNKRSLESFLAALLQFQAEELEEEVWESIWNFEDEINFKSTLDKHLPTFIFNVFNFFEVETKGALFPFAPNVYNFYLNDPISMNSTVMGECALFFHEESNFNIEN